MMDAIEKWDYQNPHIDIMNRLSIGWAVDCYETYGCLFKIEDGKVKAIGKRIDQTEA